MLLTSLLIFLAMREVWRWSLAQSLAAAGAFVVVDLSFVIANLMKVLEGGWVPLVVAAVLFFLMWTWREGRAAHAARSSSAIRCRSPTSSGTAQAKARVPGTAVYLTSRTDVVPVPLLHNLKHNKVLHQRIVLLHVTTANVPRVPPSKRARGQPPRRRFPRDRRPLRLHGAAERAARARRAAPSTTCSFRHDGHVVLRRPPHHRAGQQVALARFKIAVFEAMHRNALPATEFFRIPVQPGGRAGRADGGVTARDCAASSRLLTRRPVDAV